MRDCALERVISKDFRNVPGREENLCTPGNRGREIIAMLSANHCASESSNRNGTKTVFRSRRFCTMCFDKLRTNLALWSRLKHSTVQVVGDWRLSRAGCRDRMCRG